LNTTTVRVLCLTALCCAAGSAVGQQPPAPTAQSEAGEPRADTSNAAPANAPRAAPGAEATAPGKTGATAPGASAAAAPGTTRAAATGVAAPAAGGAVPLKPAARAAAPSGSNAPARTDRLDLGTATVTGDREQPKVMYIVPWKRSDIGDLAGKPMNSLVDEILSPVDREVFKREVVYYQAVQSDASQNGAPPKPAQQGEK
jgi:hypothetical protein